MKRFKIIRSLSSFLTVVLVILSCSFSNGQQLESLKISYTDSSLGTASMNVVYNNVHFTNNGNAEISFTIEFSAPAGWKLVSQTETNKKLKLLPSESKVLAFSILKLPKAPAKWKEGKIKITDSKTLATREYSYYLMSQPDPSFAAKTLTEELTLWSDSDKVMLPVQIKNTGNVSDIYTIYYRNKYFSLNDSVKIKLAPGKDTIFQYPLNITKNELSHLYKQSVSMLIKGSTTNTYTANYEILRPKDIIKENSSAYALVPLKIEGGAMSLGNRVTYFGAARGNIYLGEEHSLNFLYRSKQFSNDPAAGGFQRHILNLDYRNHRWRVMLGQVDMPVYFPINNFRGASVAYKTRNAEFKIAGSMRDKQLYFQNDNLSLSTKYLLNRKEILHTFSANYDKTSGLNSYVFFTEANIFSNKLVSLRLQAGAGLDDKTREVPGVEKQTSDIAGGYTFSIEKGRFRAMSNLQYFGTYFPGINNGRRNSIHDISVKLNKLLTAGVFYSSNSVRSNYFRDTLYNSDILQYNSDRYGLRIGLNGKAGNANFSSGIYQQDKKSAFLGTGRSYFFDIYYGKTWGRYGSVMLTTQNVVAQVENTDVVTTTANFSLMSRYFGLTGLYSRMPNIVTDGGQQKMSGYSEAVNGGPYVKYNFLDDKLVTTLRYNVFKIVGQEQTMAGVGGSVNYNNPKLGMGLIMDSFIPFSSANAKNTPVQNMRYAQLSFYKNFLVPIPTTRKYYDLKLVLFEDANNNNIKDLNERLLPNVQVEIDNNVFLTNSRGVIVYDNIKDGSYAINMINSSVDDLIPADGPSQAVAVYKNTNVGLAFKKGRNITGTVKLLLDSLSSTTMTADHIKVSARDTTGRTYMTLTDSKGNFNFSVPAGMFYVSINEDIFNGSDFTPRKTEYEIDLMRHNESIVTFEVEQKKRQIRFLQADAGVAKRSD